MINLLAATVPKGHKVDLENPDYTIIVEVCQVKRNHEDERKGITRPFFHYRQYV